jgi:hypothetical protein
MSSFPKSPARFDSVTTEARFPIFDSDCHSLRFLIANGFQSSTFQQMRTAPRVQLWFSLFIVTLQMLPMIASADIDTPTHPNPKKKKDYSRNGAFAEPIMPETNVLEGKYPIAPTGNQFPPRKRNIQCSDPQMLFESLKALVKELGLTIVDDSDSPETLMARKDRSKDSAEHDLVRFTLIPDIHSQGGNFIVEIACFHVATIETVEGRIPEVIRNDQLTDRTLSDIADKVGQIHFHPNKISQKSHSP